MTKAEIKKLDRLWAEAVRLKAGSQCEFCGKDEALNSHHIFSRSNRTVRWNIYNGVCLCVGHHVFGNMSAHKAPVEFIEWIKERRGKSWYAVLRLLAGGISKYIDYEELKEMLEKLIKELK